MYRWRDVEQPGARKRVTYHALHRAVALGRRS